MSKVLIINGHQPYSFSEGRLNKALVQLADKTLSDKGHDIKTTVVADGYDVDQEVANHVWADIVILQTPVNWMGVTWSTKKYMDEVYTAGMRGELCNGDGRTHDQPTKNYGGGGTAQDKKYMLSLTFNAPKEAFDDTDEYLFGGKSVDDLFFPAHMNFRFFGMTGLDTFVCFDVMKNPNIDADFERYVAHLGQNF